jgi:hypothetical protein
MPTWGKPFNSLAKEAKRPASSRPTRTRSRSRSAGDAHRERASPRSPNTGLTWKQKPRAMVEDLFGVRPDPSQRQAPEAFPCTHKAGIVKEWLAKAGCKVVLHLLPPYRPHLDPIESLWALMHENVAHKRDYTTFSELRREVIKFLRHTVPKHWKRFRDRIRITSASFTAPIFGYRLAGVLPRPDKLIHYRHWTEGAPPVRWLSHMIKLINCPLSFNSNLIIRSIPC